MPTVRTPARRTRVQHTFSSQHAAVEIPRTNRVNTVYSTNQTLPAQELCRLIRSWQSAQPVKAKECSCYEEVESSCEKIIQRYFHRGFLTPFFEVTMGSLLFVKSTNRSCTANYITRRLVCIIGKLWHLFHWTF